MRASWKGLFRIGNIVMPVKLYRATQQNAPKFIQLCARDHSRVRRVTVCEADGSELSESDIIRAVEHGGEYIEVKDSELERYNPESRDIVVQQVTDSSGISSLYLDTPYYLVPDSGGELLFAILRRALESAQKSAIASLLFYGRNRLVAISALDGLMQMQILRYHDEIVPQAEIDLPTIPQPTPQQLSTARKLLEHFSLPFHSSDYRDRQSDAIEEYVSRKARGLPPKKRPSIPAETTPAEQVVDVMESMLDDKSNTLRT